jgi:hypothetical protein
MTEQRKPGDEDLGADPEEDGAPEPDESPRPRPGTRMLELPAVTGDPARQAAQSLEKLRRGLSGTSRARQGSHEE